jgi:hypothetical protein
MNHTKQSRELCAEPAQGKGLISNSMTNNILCCMIPTRAKESGFVMIFVELRHQLYDVLHV